MRNEIALLRQHMGEQCERRNVVGQAQKAVRAPDVELGRQFIVCHIKLIQQMTRRKRHPALLGIVLGAQGFIRQVLGIPAMEKDAPTVRVMSQSVDHVVDLIDGAAVPGWPGRPLLAIDRPQLPLVGRPFVPDGHAVFVQPSDIGIPAEKPDQFIGNAFEVQFLGGE